ncbi:TlpA disulfide reductase family protein [Pedobacter heparinus]|uniref:Alkyl hydroperoxide reductase/ Thiol specific antioxidant/ Mal allergen n=1 Tax=Pedobacter heparinus (strain ATCC 13125 / DSM 2366 / CIP 104194 / JCM 7457 / NBRC 12017 / NCIMB 9290 / NRRL B-14731 / HIM 762-3) TaxID=485917 RepID=C6XVV8_PEDHD|nr:TlpA disulfide reductase family protein [Pedobacter heparinus]ACU06183.1 alkyl hydroperoxide reductase/ Thiol specific antioxidant/ Mal allergen [Pedobacter heparinus DSM 2366]
MNIKIIIVALLLLPASFCLAQDKFEISGQLSQAGKDMMVMLSYKNSEGKDTKDSALVKNGKFLISGTTAFGNKAYLTLMPVKKDTIRRVGQSDYQEFYLEKGMYKVTGTDSLAKASITGAQAQKDFLLWKSKSQALLAQFREITQRFTKVYYAKVKDTVTIKKIQAEARPVHAKIEAALDSFIFSHPDSYVALDLIASEKTAVIDPQVFGAYYNPLSKRVLASFTGQKLTAKFEKAKKISIGKTVDFTQTDDKGNEFKLSSLKGKYVLVDFWASWCVPCRAENPHLLKAYNQLKDKGFEIVGISLDETKAAWLNAVKHDGMPWIQVSDLKGFKSEIAVQYGISAIPQNFLIDPQGVIIAKNLRGEDVNEQLAKLIR